MEADLKVVVMLGSLRKGSLHRALANSLQSLAPSGVTLNHLDSVGEFPHYDADLQAQGFPSPVTRMGTAIGSADAVVVVTPEYNYSIPGALKNAFDWLSRLPDTPFAGKPVSIMTGSPGPIGGARAQYHLRQVMVFLDALVFNKPEVMVGAIQTKVDAEAGTLTDQATRDFVAKHLEAFAGFARRLA